jgi:Protein of unknown function (DUF3592)
MKNIINSDNIVGFVFIILGVVIAVGYLFIALKRRRARRWPTAVGHVQSTLVRTEERGENMSKRVAYVTYSYEVLGESHSGSFKREFILDGRAQKWIGGYPIGRALSVRVNPFKPADSLVLEREQTVPGAQPAAAGK